jgi:scyllo-inositol 2-dehydrogenase (NADP+)
MIRAGLIGYGLAGAVFHAPLIDAVDGFALAAVASSRAEAVVRDWPGIPAVSAQSVLADPDIDLVVIATPNDSHAPLARAAIEAGKHVVIEKPFACDAAEGEALAALAAERGRVLTVFQNRRWDGDFLTVARLLAAGRIGRPVLYEARWDRFRTGQRAGWKDEPGRGAGLLPDFGAHLIDQALQLFGPPEAIEADLAIQREHGVVEDYFELALHYGRMRAILSASTLVAAPRPRFAVHGTGGSFVKYGLDPQETWMRDGGRPADPGYGEDAPELFGILTDAAGEVMRVPTERGDYRAFYEGVARAILDGAPPPVAPAEAIAGLQLIALARQSAAEGRRIAIG